MHERDASSRTDYQSAQQALDAARTEIKALDAQIAQYSVQIETAKANMGYTRITAPSDGVVVSIVTKEGQTVSASQSAPTIIKLANLNTMRIETQISITYLTPVCYFGKLLYMERWQEHWKIFVSYAAYATGARAGI